MNEAKERWNGVGRGQTGHHHSRQRVAAISRPSRIVFENREQVGWKRAQKYQDLSPKNIGSAGAHKEKRLLV